MYVYNSSMFTILHVLHRRVGFLTINILWVENRYLILGKLLEDMFVEQLFFEEDLQQ